jgi:hypothetical protein
LKTAVSGNDKTVTKACALVCARHFSHIALLRPWPSPVPNAARPQHSSASSHKASSPSNKTVFANREQLLAFNRARADQARVRRIPCSKAGEVSRDRESNPDEFFEIRGLMQQADSESSGLSTTDSLRVSNWPGNKNVNELVADQYACWHRELMPARKAGIRFRTAGQPMTGANG